MATRFECVLHGDDPASLRAAGEEALDEIERLEAQLSLFRPDSEIAAVNARAASAPVRVTPTVFRLLQQARKLSHETGGAFDITVAPLVRCWGFMEGTGRVPSAAELAAVRERVGMTLVELDEDEFTVRFARPGMMLDLGAIGKGCAIERAAEILRDDGVTSALIHGGTSSVYALGHPPDSESWQVGIDHPETWTGGQATRQAGGSFVRLQGPGARTSQAAPGQAAARLDDPASAPRMITVPLRDESLSVSAVWGKFFRADGKVLGHVLDPRTGWPAAGALLAAVVLPSATESDALSTALLTIGAHGHEHIARLRPGMRTLLATETEGQVRLESRGAWTGVGDS